ncbi:hypothetical protein TrispH2_011825, partial [Trichoplax sp. H2]
VQLMNPKNGRGLLNSGNIKLLAVSTTMIKKTKPEDSQLGRVLLLILLRLCKDLSNSKFHYQAVQSKYSDHILVLGTILICATML